MEMLKVKIYEGLKGRCFRLNHNPGSPYVDETKDYSGMAITMPTEGVRFRCGSLDTNIVAKIIGQTDDLVRFVTLSGSVYEFQIEEKGNIVDELDLVMSEEIVLAINEYNSKTK